MSNIQPTARTATILVVDDQEPVVSLLKDFLSIEGYAVCVAYTGLDAIRVASETKPDLIIMDIMMPGMDGYEATDRIKQNPELRDTPVIFLSGRTAQEDGGRAFAKGGLTFVRKPFTGRQIRDLISLTLQSLSGS